VSGSKEPDMTGYWNEVNPKETKEIIANERTKDTFLSRAEADAALEAQGRFKRQNETRIVGSGGPTYPAGAGPWSPNYAPAVPPDPHTDQIDYDPNFVEPVVPERPDADPESGSASPRSSVEQRGQGGSIARTANDAPSQPPSRFKRRF
jgi:hypothetical protein